MKIKQVLIMLILSGLILIASLGLSLLYVRSQLDLVEVVVAKSDLEPRTQIRAEDLERIQMPKAMLKGSYYTKQEDILNLYVKIQNHIPKGSLIYTSVLESLDESIDYPRLLLRENQAVVSLNVDLVSTAGKTIQKNQKIDIYGTLKINRETFVDRLFHQVRVLNVLDKNGDELGLNVKQVPKVMLIAMNREYVSILTKLVSIGHITITVTSIDDTDLECVLNEQSSLLEHLYVQ